MKKVKNSIQNQIIATGLCPLIIMSTTIGVISQRGGSPILIANVIAFILLMGIIQLIYIASIIVKPIQIMEFSILQLAEGNLDISIEEKITKRNDEIGSMSESLNKLSNQLKNSMTEIQKVSEKLVNSEEGLNQMVGESNHVAIQINSSTQKILDDATAQSRNMEEASINTREIGNLIAEITGSVKHVDDTLCEMKEDSNQAVMIMTTLDKSNEHTNDAIERINKQVNLTYEASLQINTVIQMIASISKQTMLLALNASIEAARAGENGKGFSVVAAEINDLASQTSHSVKEIDAIVSNLSMESEKMLEIMEDVLVNVSYQRSNLVQTQETFEKVNNGIEDLINEIVEIKKETMICNDKKDKVTKHIETLSLISKDNVSSTRDTLGSIIRLNNSIKEIELRSNQLVDFANELDIEVRFYNK